MEIFAIYLKGDSSTRTPLSINPKLTFQVMFSGSPRGVINKVPRCSLEISEFEVQSSNDVHFKTNALEKGMNPYPLSPNYESNSITTFQQI